MLKGKDGQQGKASTLDGAPAQEAGSVAEAGAAEEVK